LAVLSLSAAGRPTKWPFEKRSAWIKMTRVIEMNVLDIFPRKILLYYIEQDGNLEYDSPTII